MKKVVNMSRLVNQLEKMFRALNADFFGGELEPVIITVTPSAKSYAHYTPWAAWQAGEEGRREINIASGTLNRPLENIAASLLHEMCHEFNDVVLHVQDCSRNGTYHNRRFYDAAVNHGLLCYDVPKYGYAKTEPSDSLLEWVLLHDEFREIEMCRIDEHMAAAIGTHTSDRSGDISNKPTAKTHNYKWVCPCCGAIARSGKQIRLICGDCLKEMIEG